MIDLKYYMFSQNQARDRYNAPSGCQLMGENTDCTDCQY